MACTRPLRKRRSLRQRSQAKRDVQSGNDHSNTTPVRACLCIHTLRSPSQLQGREATRTRGLDKYVKPFSWHLLCQVPSPKHRASGDERRPRRRTARRRAEVRCLGVVARGHSGAPWRPSMGTDSERVWKAWQRWRDPRPPQTDPRVRGVAGSVGFGVRRMDIGRSRT